MSDDETPRTKIPLTTAQQNSVRELTVSRLLLDDERLLGMVDGGVIGNGFSVADVVLDMTGREMRDMLQRYDTELARLDKLKDIIISAKQQTKRAVVNAEAGRTA